MTVVIYKVDGMTCGHCVSTVTAAVGSVSGVEEVEVDLAAGTVTTTGTPSDSAVAKAISQAGYDVVSSESRPVTGSGLPLVGSPGLRLRVRLNAGDYAAETQIGRFRYVGSERTRP